MTFLQPIETEFGLNDDERMILESVRQMCAAQLAPRAAHFDETGEFPHENVAAINALGLNGLFIPEEYGGAGTSLNAYLTCCEEIAAACASTGIIWATNFHAIKPVIDLGTEELKARVLPAMAEGALAALVITEPEAGSDATGMRTTFTQDGDEIVVDGMKTFITNGDQADFLLVFGKWAGETDRKAAISCLLMEKGTEGFKVERLEDKLGHRASSTATLTFSGCRVPRANLLAGPGQGLKMLLSSLNKSRPSVAAHALGIGRAAMDASVKYINERKQSGRRIVEFQGIQFLLADLAAEYAMCRSYLAQIGRRLEAGDTNIGTEASILKLKSTDWAMRMTTEAIQLHGGYGYCKEFPVERYFRDAKITQIWEGTNQIHRQNIGRAFIAR